MTYYYDNPLYPKEPIINLAVTNQLEYMPTGFACAADSCKDCILNQKSGVFCVTPGEIDNPIRKRIATDIKQNYPELFI